jgi:biopolymer transport protein ExbB
MEFTAVGLWEAMGLSAKAVVVVLLFLSVYSITIMVERGLLLRQARRQSQDFSDRSQNVESFADVLELTRSPELGERCYLAQVIQEALEDSQSLIEDGDVAAATAAAQAAVTRKVTVTMATLRKRLVHLASTAAGAPFLGLFGTVLGLIRAFQNIATTGSGGLTSVASGISEALITTLVGLFVAIPALWGHNVFSDRIDTLVVDLDSTASRLVDRLIRREVRSRRAQGTENHGVQA